MTEEQTLRTPASMMAPASVEEEPEPEEEGVKRNKYGFKIVTMGDLGARLPMGVPAGNPATLHKDFDFKEFYSEQDEDLNKIRSKKGGPGSHAGKLVTASLSYMLERWGDRSDFQTTADKNRRSMIDNSFMEDVIYAWAYMRAETLSPKLEIEVTCNACDHEFLWRGDLLKAEVAICDDIRHLQKQFELLKPIEWNGKKYDVLYIEPPRWSAVSMHPLKKGSQGDVKRNLMFAAIKGAGNKKDGKQTPIAVGGSVAKRLHKLDMEQLTTVVDEGFPGADFNFQVECEECGFDFLWLLRWNYDFFFGGASLPRRKTS